MGIEEHMGGLESAAFAILDVEAGVADVEVVGFEVSELEGDGVDPVGWAFEFHVVADGGFVDHEDAVFAGDGPFGAELFVLEAGDEAEALEDEAQDFGVTDEGFELFAFFVAGDGGGTLISKDGRAAGLADADEFAAGAESCIRGVVDDVGFEDSGMEDLETERAEARFERVEIGYRHLDLIFLVYSPN
jgi:hypothetical protein